ncbi:RidA family protein [Pseudomonas frederiksbergensis]|uniref:RidA family protein n=1 Tax=Pseudomonas frederiksbergensis TaxID=104087 RepID=UPI0006254DEB|nr:Rid family hydrolase [Pseudomonas frederiksbergensis]KHK61550.2 hypothetical protein JZ00_27825 [Pseudomonas frederiksbergensis]
MKIFNNVPALNKVANGLSIKNSLAIDTGELVYFSGWAGVDLESGVLLEGGDIEEHAKSALDAYELILEEAGLSLDNVVKVNCFLADPVNDFPAWNEVFKARFNQPYPCRTTVGAPLVAGRIEIEIVASKSSRLRANAV